MELAFNLIAIVIWIAIYLYYVTPLQQTKEGFWYWCAGQIVWISCGYGGAELIKLLSKAIFH